MAFNSRLKEAFQRHCPYDRLVSATDPRSEYRRVGIEGTQGDLTKPEKGKEYDRW